MSRGGEAAFAAGFGQGGCIVKGMTLREWFAGQALAGLMANPCMDRFNKPTASGAALATNAADALLAALGEGEAPAGEAHCCHCALRDDKPKSCPLHEMEASGLRKESSLVFWCQCGGVRDQPPEEPKP